MDAPVDPHLEAAEIHRRVIAAGGPALLFTNVTGADFRLVTNLFGTARRAELAFGERPLRLVRRLVELAETLLPPTPAKLWGARDVALRAAQGRHAAAWRTVPSSSRHRDVRLDRLPAHDVAGPRTAGRSSRCRSSTPSIRSTRGHNLGHVPHAGARRRDDRHALADRQGRRLPLPRGRGAGQPLPVTVFLGGPPALILSAIAPLPENVPELMLASLIAGERLPQVHGARAAPADGRRRVRADRRRAAARAPARGPFGDHYGYYSLQHDYPVFDVQRIAHRADAMFPATVVGKPRQEDFFIGDLLQELLSPLFPLVMPAVETAVVVRRDRLPLACRRGRQAALRARGDGQRVPHPRRRTALADEVPARHRSRTWTCAIPATLEHILARTNPETDLYVFSNLSMDTLDYTGPAVNKGSKGVWLGLGEPVRELPRQFRRAPLPAGVTDVRVFCGGCLVVGGARVPRRTRARPRASPAMPRSATGRSWC